MPSLLPVVSVVTPCYNGAAYLPRYFDSILGQEYPSIQLIFVDDGSTDDTYAIAASFRAQLEARGIAFELLHQENRGQAAALNTGLKKVIGEYITWPDSDDLMAPDCIAAKVEYLETHSAKGFVRSSLEVVRDTNINQVIDRQMVNARANPYIFDDLIHDRGPFFSGIAYMARTESLFRALDGRHIYESKAGQNWQLLIPLAYASQCGFIEAPLGKYVVRENSHSRSFKSPREQLQRTYDLEDLLRHILANLPLSPQERQTCDHYLAVKYQNQRFWLALTLGDRNLLMSANKTLSNEYGHSAGRNFCLILAQIGLGPSLCYIKYFGGHVKRIVKRVLKPVFNMCRHFIPEKNNSRKG